MNAEATIVVCTFNRPDWLAVSLNSIKTSAAFARLGGIETRVLVLDDASPGDATREVVQALGVDYVRNPVNDGRNDPNEARVLGLRAVDTPYYAFFDDDDVALPRWVRLHVEALRAGVDICSTAYFRTDENLLPTREVVPAIATMADLLAGRVSINTHSMVRTDAARSAPWEPEWENVMEYQVWFDLMFRGYRFDRITEPTYLHRRHGSNMSDKARADPRDSELRRLMIERYRAKVLARDGVLPESSAQQASRRSSNVPRRAARLTWRSRVAGVLPQGIRRAIRKRVVPPG